MELWLPGEDVGEIYGRKEECSLVFARMWGSQRQWRVAVKFSVLRLNGEDRGRGNTRAGWFMRERGGWHVCCGARWSTRPRIGRGGR